MNMKIAFAEILLGLLLLAMAWFLLPPFFPGVISTSHEVMQAIACVIVACVAIAALADAEDRFKFWWHHRHLRIPVRY